MVGARATDANVRLQEKVRRLTEENAALRVQLAEQEQRLQRDAREEVSGVWLFITCASAYRWPGSIRAAQKLASRSLHTSALAGCAPQESPC